jgi:hypothetical protein
MRKVSLIGNSLAYLLCQEAKRATEYRPGMTPEDVGAVSEKSVRQHETTRGRNAPFDFRRAQLLALLARASECEIASVPAGDQVQVCG